MQSSFYITHTLLFIGNFFKKIEGLAFEFRVKYWL
jgi:hypothetical protein